MRKSRSTFQSGWTEQPFSIELLVVGLPSKFCFPDMKFYERTSDPIEHLETYQSLMELHGYSDATKYPAFHLTLIGIMRQWYWTVHLGTISTFRDLAGAFISQFSVHKVHKKPTHQISTIIQRENKSTEAYLARFAKEEMLVEDW